MNGFRMPCKRVAALRDQVLPGHGSSAAPSIWAFVDVSRSGSPFQAGPAPAGGVATGSPASTASSTEVVDRRNHPLIRSRLMLAARVGV